MRTLLGCALVVVLGAGAAADNKTETIDAQKLVGKWKGATKHKEALEFTKDGKLKLTSAMGDLAEGTYKVEGNKVKFVATIDGEKVDDVITVSKLTDTELVILISGSAKKVETFTRVK